MSQLIPQVSITVGCLAFPRGGGHESQIYSLSLAVGNAPVSRLPDQLTTLLVWSISTCSPTAYPFRSS